MNVNPGEHIALVGHSGCGKSTLTSLLMRFYDLENGTISIDDINIATMNMSSLRNLIGIVNQEPTLFCDTVENNIRLGAPGIDDDQIEHFCRLANAHEFIQQLEHGYKTVIGKGGVELSGGQQQRLVIARTLARKPTILVLDEATSALDPESEFLVKEALKTATMNRTTITIAHRLSTIRNCNRIYVFEEGSVVEVGTHEELIRMNRHYAKMVKQQELEYSFESDEESGLTQELLSNSTSSQCKVTNRFSKRPSETSEALVSQETQNGSDERDGTGIYEVLRFVKPEWCLLLLAILLSLLRGLSNPIFSMLYGNILRIYSTGTDEEKKHNSEMNALYFFVLAVYSGAVMMGSGYLFEYLGEKLCNRLRLQVFSNALRQDGSYFDNPEHVPIKLTTQISEETPKIRAAVDHRLTDIFQILSTVISASAIAFSYERSMAGYAIFYISVLISVQSIITYALKNRHGKDSKISLGPLGLAIEAIEKHRTVQYLTREEHFVKKFDEGMKPFLDRKIVSRLLESLSIALAISFTYINFTIGYSIGISLVERNMTSPSLVFQVIESFTSVAPCFVSIGTYLPDFAKGLDSAKKLFRLTRDESKINNNTDVGKKIILNGKITLNNVYFRYPIAGRKMVLKDFSLEIQNGKTTAIVGVSGCGKSTTFQLLERFHDPIAGNINYDDECVKDLNLKCLRSQIALVGQHPILFDGSIQENIAYGLENVTEEDVIEAAKSANAHDFITEMTEGYKTKVTRGGSNLSGGQKQRIAIARALVRKPKILLLDEATSALDPENEKLVQEALDKAKTGRTCVVIAHRVQTIQGADCIAFVKNGQVVEQGTHQQLLSLRGEYANFVRISLS